EIFSHNPHFVPQRKRSQARVAACFPGSRRSLVSGGRQNQLPPLLAARSDPRFLEWAGGWDQLEGDSPMRPLPCALKPLAPKAFAFMAGLAFSLSAASAAETTAGQPAAPAVEAEKTETASL